jgi:hypothetical protein
MLHDPAVLNKRLIRMQNDQNLKQSLGKSGYAGDIGISFHRSPHKIQEQFKPNHSAKRNQDDNSIARSNCFQL